MSPKPTYEELEKQVAELERQVERLQVSADKHQTLSRSFPRGITVSDANGYRIDHEELNRQMNISETTTERNYSEEFLKGSERKYRQLFTEMVSGAGLYEIICDKTGKPVDFLTLEVNRAFESLVGVKRQEVVGKTFREISSVEDKDHWIEKFGKVALTGESTTYQRYASADNQYFEGTVYSPQYGQFAITFTNVTERVSAQERVVNQAKSLDTIFNSAPNILLLFNDKGRVDKINYKGIDFSGRESEEVIGLLGGQALNCRNSFNGKGCGRNTACRDCPVRTKVEGTLTTGKAHIEEEGQMTVLVDGDATRLDLLISTKLLESQGAKQVLVSITDITKLKTTERSLEESREQYILALKGSRDGIWDWDLRTSQLFLSPRSKEILGYEDHEFPSDIDVVKAHIHPDDWTRVKEYLEQYLKGDIPVYSIEYRLRHKNGSYRWVLARGEALRDEHGLPYRMAGSHSDITDRKQSEQYNRMLVEMLDTAPSAITIHDFDGRFCYANRKTFKVLCFTKEEYAALNLYELNAPASRSQLKRRMQIIEAQGETTFNAMLIRKDGITVPMEVFAKKVRWENQSAMLSVATDITERIRTEKALKELQGNLIALIENADDVMVLRDAEGKAIVFNKAFAEIVRRLFNVEAKTGMRTMDFLPENKKYFWEKVIAKVQTGISHREEYDWEIDGQRYYFDSSFNPIMVGNKIIGTAEITRDITKRKKLEARIQQSQKMEAIGNLAGGIAHDFNNILFPIVAMAELLMEDLPNDSQEYENAQEIFHAAKRGSDLVKQILTFSRQAENKMIPVRVQQIVKEALKLIRAMIPAYIEIEEDIQPDCGLILADPTQIHQVVMNIITNAFHAVESKGGKITVKVKEVEAKADGLITEPLCQERCTLLSISDNGHGIPPDIRNKIFEPYFTTKEQGKGTGLGLAVAYGIIKGHKGNLKVYSNVGKGTTFDIYLPLMVKGKEVSENKTSKTDFRGNEHILVVDDEAQIVRLEKQILERLGYQVTACVSSTEALSLFKADCGLFDLVLSDMTMPKIPGDCLARQLIAIRPDIPIILCTGFSERVTQKNAVDVGAKGFLMKPIVKADMAKTIRKILDEAKESRQQ